MGKTAIKRAAGGRFAKGGAPKSPGNPIVRQTNQLRAELIRAVTVEDIRAIVKKLAEEATTATRAAIREVLDRTVGKPAVELHHEAVQIEVVFQVMGEAGQFKLPRSAIR